MIDFSLNLKSLLLLFVHNTHTDANQSNCKKNYDGHMNFMWSERIDENDP